MPLEGRRAFGARVAELRRQRDLTQSELAAAIGRTASWVSQVERGIQPVNRLDVLRLLAEGLGVPLQVLQPEAPGAARPDMGVTDEALLNDLDQARLVISGHSALDVVLEPREDFRADLLHELRDEVERVWRLAHGDQFAELGKALGTLLPRLERAARTAPGEFRPEIHRLLARSYQALSAAFVRQDEADAAWLAADRAIRAAELAGDRLGVFVGVFRLVHAFVRLKRLDQAEHAAATALNTLARHAEAASTPVEELSVVGSLHLALASVHARAGERSAVREQIDRARNVAARMGVDRNDFNLEFGPTNVEVQAVSTAVDLGDAGEALDTAKDLDIGAMSVERQARLLMDLGRAHLQRRQFGDALACLLRAEEIAPDLVRSHIAARGAIRELMLMGGRSASPELRGLAERADAMG
ncbi:transcriptional regulator [Streptomyces cellostaticus]|uniref:Transcriptional regulator n=1 Tax=Streptomyces cellostaticus TaxID=67285 RepID=A0A101NGU1_9ACTN|nr:helix-turn-helix transcriptional regulator [Streptomyces cellostaticus]KUM92832.1 transcriptional regulator [Streptomyces cellostaticus]GHI06743.1 transcriptional regulator [Streptomyces cellostaticus]